MFKIWMSNSNLNAKMTIKLRFDVKTTLMGGLVVVIGTCIIRERCSGYAHAVFEINTVYMSRALNPAK